MSQGGKWSAFRQRYHVERRSGEECARISKVFGVTYRGHKKIKGSPLEGRPATVCEAVCLAEGPHELSKDNSRASLAGVSTSYVSVPSLESSLARILTLLEDISSTAHELVERISGSAQHVGATPAAPDRLTLEKVNRSADQTPCCQWMVKPPPRPALRPSIKVSFLQQPRVGHNPRATLEELLDLAKAAARKGDKSWTQFYRSKSLYRFCLRPEEVRTMKELFKERPAVLQGGVPLEADKEQVVSLDSFVPRVSRVKARTKT